LFSSLSFLLHDLLYDFTFILLKTYPYHLILLLIDITPSTLIFTFSQISFISYPFYSDFSLYTSPKSNSHCLDSTLPAQCVISYMWISATSINSECMKTQIIKPHQMNQSRREVFLSSERSRCVTCPLGARAAESSTTSRPRSMGFPFSFATLCNVARASSGCPDAT
jgi:hypothetical protein